MKLQEFHPPIYYDKDFNRRRGSQVNIPYPLIFPEEVPRPYRRFCCFVGVEGRKSVGMGSGTLISFKSTIGVLSSFHLFENDSFNIFVAFIQQNNTSFEIELPCDCLLWGDEEEDLIIFQVPELPPEFKPIKNIIEVRQLNVKQLFNQKLYAFGCPAGVLGKIWYPRLITISDGLIYTRGYGVPGVSGGGMFIREKDEFHLIGVHIEIDIYNKTLRSRAIPPHFFK